MGTTTAVTVKVHPGTPPTTLLEFHQHNDLDGLPDFDDDNKVVALEYNAWVTRIKAMAEAQRLLSTLVGVAPDTATIGHLVSVIHEATLAASGIPKTKAGFASDLQQAFQTGLQSLTDGLTVSAALSASHYFIQTEGLIDVPTAFSAGAILGTSSDGLFKTFPAGKFPPTAFVRATGKANYAAGGRVIADGITARFNPSGELEVVAGGRDYKESVRAATAAAGTLASDFENGDTIDGVVLATGNRILIKNQAAGTENGIYTVNASGAPTRADDFLSGASAANNIVTVEEGTLNADRIFQCINNVSSDVVGTDALVFTKAGPGSFENGGEATGADRTLGNTDAFALALLTNNLKRLEVQADGDVDVVSGAILMAATELISATRDVTLLDGSTIRFGVGISMTIAGSGAQDGIVITAQDATGDTLKLVVNQDVIVTQRGFRRSVASTLTAGTTQTQGQQALTEDINEVATVANANDVVTLRTARIGGYQTIINNGANILQIFPATGDDLGSGVNASTTLAASGSITFLAYDITNWKGVANGNGLLKFQFFADQFDNPVNADWTINALAPAAADSNNAGETVRLFDDTAEEGIGFILTIPSNAINIKFTFRSRAETTPGAVRTVGLKLYNRGIPNNAAVEAWSAGTVLTDIDIPVNEFFQDDTQTLTLATLGLTAGETTQFELTRINPVGGTELIGDWALLELIVEFT